MVEGIGFEPVEDSILRYSLPHKAEAARFELAIPFGMPPFQGGGINHYPTPPLCEGIPIYKQSLHSYINKE